MAQELDLSNIYKLNNADEWQAFIGYTNKEQQFVGFPLAMVMYEADHCHFCREALPLVNELAGIYRGIIAVGLVDLDSKSMIVAGTPLAPGEAEGKTIIKGVTGTPQFWMYKLGKSVDHISGKDNDTLKKMFAYWASNRS